MDTNSQMVPFYKYRRAARIIRQFRVLQGGYYLPGTVMASSPVEATREREYKMFTRNSDLYHYLINIV